MHNHVLYDVGLAVHRISKLWAIELERGLLLSTNDFQPGVTFVSYKLYNRNGSGGYVVEAALALAQTRYELVELESIPSTPLPDSFREVNPWRQVPALITPAGATLTESAAIIIHLAAEHQDKDLGPRPGTPQHAQFLRWIIFLSANAYESVLRKTYPARYTSDPNGVDAVAESARERLGDSLGLVELQLRENTFLVGECMSIADVYLAMLNAWYSSDNGWPHCDALTHKVASHSIIKPIWQKNFGHRLETQWGENNTQ